MKKLLVLCLSLVLTASIIAGPIETFNMEVSKITKDMTDASITPQMAAGKIYDAREKLFVAGGSALRKSAGLKARIEQIKAKNKDFATEWNAIEKMQGGAGAIKTRIAQEELTRKLEEEKLATANLAADAKKAKIAADTAAAEAKKLAADISKLKAQGIIIEEGTLKDLADAKKEAARQAEVAAVKLEEANLAAANLAAVAAAEKEAKIAADAAEAEAKRQAEAAEKAKLAEDTAAAEAKRQAEVAEKEAKLAEDTAAAEVKRQAEAAEKEKAKKAKVAGKEAARKEKIEKARQADAEKARQAEEKKARKDAEVAEKEAKLAEDTAAAETKRQAEVAGKEAKKLVTKAYDVINSLLKSTSGIATFSLQKPQLLKAYENPEKVAQVLATYKQAIKNYEKATGSQDDFSNDHVNKYNYYPLAIYEAFVEEGENKDTATKQQYLKHITDAINTLFIYHDYKVIPSSYSTHFNSKPITRSDIIIKAEQDLGLGQAEVAGKEATEKADAAGKVKVAEKEAKKLFNIAYAAVRNLLSAKRAVLRPTTYYLEPKVIKSQDYEKVIKPALAKFKKSIEVYESTTGSITETILDMKKNYNFYPLEINRQILIDEEFKKARKEKADQLTAIVNNNIDTLFTDANGFIIPGNGSQVDVINKAKVNLKTEAEEVFNLEEFVDAREASRSPEIAELEKQLAAAKDPIEKAGIQARIDDLLAQK